MVGTAVLLAALMIASVTDIRSGKIYNWTTYPGILLAIGCSAVATMWEVDSINGTQQDFHVFGFVHLRDCLLGFFSCAALMLICFVFFPVGGGDVKLISMMGAFLGVYDGLEAMLWTFVIAACLALIHLVWKYGALRFITTTAKYGLYLFRLGPFARLTKEERRPLQVMLMLSPSALLAVVIVRFDLVQVF